MKKKFSEMAPRLAFFGALLFFAFVYGYLTKSRGLPPARFIATAKQGWSDLKERMNIEKPWYYIPTGLTRKTVVHDADAVSPGLTLIGAIGADGHLFARIIDRDGQIINEWNLDWFDIWPHATHLAKDLLPKSAPGTFLHGMLLTEDGGLIFNYEGLGMVRVDACGKVVWRLPERTHHSLFRDDDGDIWSPLVVSHPKAVKKWRYYNPSWDEFFIIKVSPDGKVLFRKSVYDLMRENDLLGMLYMAPPGHWGPEMHGDALHLNDVEVFSAKMTPGFFQPGDIMISLRNINSIVVFESKSLKVKYVSAGHYIRQHDPDFVDGNTISVFDNHDLGEREDGIQSRIVLESVPSGKTKIAFQGTRELPFYTDIMGREQWLPNGNLLVLEARNGRILEIDPTGRLVWEYNNIVQPGLLAALSDVVRLSPEMTADRLRQLRAACQEDNANGDEKRIP